MSNEQKQPHEGKPLTAEHYADKHYVTIKGENFVSIGDFIASLKDYAAQQTAAFREELEHLKEWKRQQLATFAPLLDYGQSKEAGLSLGSSIVQEAIKALKEWKGMREELEAVKKERDSLKGTTTKSWVALNFERHEHKKIRDQLSEVTRQRDEAVKLLLKWRRDLIDGCGPANCIDEFLSRISSGETNRPENPERSTAKTTQIALDGLIGDLPRMTGITHDLKCWMPYFSEISSGMKLFEVRKNDRNFQVGDELFIREWNQTSQEYSGYNSPNIITYILNGGQFGVQEGYCVLGILPKELFPARNL